MADEIYNSSFTGAQIDEAISDVRTNKDTWNNAATKADDNATAISALGTSTENRFTELEEDISNNATDISNLSGTVSGHTTDISALQLGVQANQENFENYLPLSGGTMAGNLIMGTKSLTFSRDSEIYDDGDGVLNIVAGNFDINIRQCRIIGASKEPTVDSELTNKAYVDSVIADKAPMYTYGTEDLEAGTSELETGKLYFVYE